MFSPEPSRPHEGQQRASHPTPLQPGNQYCTLCFLLIHSSTSSTTSTTVGLFPLGSSSCFCLSYFFQSLLWVFLSETTFLVQGSSCETHQDLLSLYTHTPCGHTWNCTFVIVRNVASDYQKQKNGRKRGYNKLLFLSQLFTIPHNHASTSIMSLILRTQNQLLQGTILA